jgi:uncharacterized coiled-coil protein SlyX
MKEEINKDMEPLKNNQSERNNSISQIHIVIKSLANRVKQVENRVSGMEDKVEELDQTVKDHKRMLRKYDWNMQDIWHEGEEVQIKGIDNLFNRIIAENFLNFKKERVNQVQEAYRTPTDRTKKETPQTHHNQNTQHTEQRKNSESCKREKTSHT